MGLNPVPNIADIERLRVYPAGINAGRLILRDQFVGVGGLGKTRGEGHGDFRALQFRGEVFAQLVNQFNAFGMGHQSAAGEGIGDYRGLKWQKFLQGLC